MRKISAFLMETLQAHSQSRLVARFPGVETRSQVCQVNLTANFNGSNGSGYLSGTLCGRSVNATFQ